MARKVPEHVAYRLAEKAKAAEKKAKDAEKKAKDAEKKAKEADKKVKAADKKVKAAETDSDDLDDFDDFDDLDDFDDFDDFEEEQVEEESHEQKEDKNPNEASDDDDDLDALLKEASASEGSDVKISRANRLAKDGNFNGALEIWKELTANEGNEPSNWRGLASVLESRDNDGDAEKAKTAREHADRIETQAIAEATGRKMEDIIADLLDDGVLNFSAGSDSKDTD